MSFAFMLFLDTIEPKDRAENTYVYLRLIGYRSMSQQQCNDQYNAIAEETLTTGVPLFAHVTTVYNDAQLWFQSMMISIGPDRRLYLMGENLDRVLMIMKNKKMQRSEIRITRDHTGRLIFETTVCTWSTSDDIKMTQTVKETNWPVINCVPKKISDGFYDIAIMSV